MLLNIDDFLSDVDVKYVFTPEENWAYFCMICELWKNNGKILNNFDKFWKIFGKKTKKTSKKTWSVISRKFIISDDFIQHKRVSYELQLYENKRLKMSEGGKKGVEKKKMLQAGNSKGSLNHPSTYNTIQYNTIETCIDRTSIQGLDIGKTKNIFDLNCLIVEKQKACIKQINNILHPAGKEITVFGKIFRYFVMLTEKDEKNIQLFTDAIEWAKIAKVEGRRPKAYFVDMVKRKTGFKSKSHYDLAGGLLENGKHND